MPNALADSFVVDFAVQVRIWNAAWWGDVSEPVAGIAEDRSGNYEGSTGRSMWDRTARDLSGQVVAYGDEDYRRVPDWWALPYLVEHVVRGHAEYVR